MVTDTGQVYSLNEEAFGGDMYPQGLVKLFEITEAKTEIEDKLEALEMGKADFELRRAELDEMEEHAADDRLVRVSAEVVQRLRLGDKELRRRRQRRR
jgi:hypothetical protein